MPRHCSAGGCKSRDTRESRKAGITFHRLPKRENPRRARWIINSQRTGPQGQGLWDPQSNFIYFCSKHFTAESFELSGVSGYRRLKDDALPTVFECQKGKPGKRTTRGRSRQADTGRAARSSLKEEVIIGEAAAYTSETANTEASQEGVTAGFLPQASSETPVTPLQTHKSTCEPMSDPPQPPSSPRPLSPSRYMRRLPPPPGFYLPREHSYAQLCPLVWRKRYERAIDNLEKALRLLSAARRRENRLRHTLVRLRESRLKSTLFRLREGGSRTKEGWGGRWRPSSWSSQRGGGSEPLRPEKGASSGSMEDSEVEGPAEDLEALGDEAGGWRGRGRMRGAGEEDDGCCFYCGRGREDEGPKERVQRTVEVDGGIDEKESEGSRRKQVIKRGRVRKLREVRGDDGGAPKECYLYYYQTSEMKEDMQVVTLKPPNPQGDEETQAIVDIHGNPLRSLPIMHKQAKNSLAGGTFSTITLQDSTSASFQLIQPNSSLNQGLLLTDLAPSEGTVLERQQEYWVQEAMEGSMILIPVPSTEDSGVDTVRGLTEDVKTQTIFVSDIGFHNSTVEDGERLRGEGNTVGLRARGPTDRQGSFQSNVRGVVIGDVKEKLKEHLEGFQLQLSNEFTD